MSKHAVVWLDHKEAHISHMHPDRLDDATIAAPAHIHHKHPKGPGEPKEHPDDAKRFFHEIAKSLEGTEALLIIGPSTAKLEFLRYLHKHDHALEQKIVGIETVDHPTDGQVIAYAKTYFRRTDRMA